MSLGRDYVARNGSSIVDTCRFPAGGPTSTNILSHPSRAAQHPYAIVLIIWGRVIKSFLNQTLGCTNTLLSA
jgi:hypothetical protein